MAATIALKLDIAKLAQTLITQIQMEVFALFVQKGKSLEKEHVQVKPFILGRIDLLKFFRLSRKGLSSL